MLVAPSIKLALNERCRRGSPSPAPRPSWLCGCVAKNLPGVATEPLSTGSVPNKIKADKSGKANFRPFPFQGRGRKETIDIAPCVVKIFFTRSMFSSLLNKLALPDCWQAGPPSLLWRRWVLKSWSLASMLKLLLGLEFILLLSSIPKHAVNGDEAWFAEQAFFYVKDGFVHSNLFKGLTHQDEYIVIYHRVFIDVVAGVFKIFHFGLTQIRSISLVCTVVLIGLLTVFQKRTLTFSKTQILLSTCLLIGIPQIFLYSKIARPEIMVTLFGFLSFWALYAGIERGSWAGVVAGAAFAALAMLAHLYGAVFVGAGIIYCLIRRAYFKAGAFACVCLLFCSFYILDIVRHYDIFVAQLHSPLMGEKARLGVSTPFINLANEYKRLFRKPEIIFTSCLFLFSLSFSLKSRDQRIKAISIYSVLIMLILGIIAQSKLVRYSIYLAPFQAIIICYSLTSDREKRWSAVGTWLVLCFFGYALYYEMKDTFDKFDTLQTSSRTGKHIPTNAWCCAPMSFLFNELERVNIVSGILIDQEANSNGGVRKWCDQRGITYLVFDNSKDS